MKYLFVVTLAIAFCSTGCFKDPLPHPPPDIITNPNHPLKTGLQEIIDKYIEQGIPGLQVVVRDKDGWFITQGGYSNLENKTLLKGNNETWLFSITKTYTAALIMKLRENNQINLDSRPIMQYLPAAISAKLKGSDKITIRMLLDHSSGVVNFLDLDEFRERQFSDPTKQPTDQELLDMVYKVQPMFEPGTQTYYSNTNYLLLGIILQQLTGKSYESLLRSQIIEPLQLQHTFYNLTHSQLSGFPNYYIDPNGNGQVQNGTAWNNALGMNSRYWGGIAARPTDVILFYDALVKGRVVNAASLQEMQQFKNDYGLGIESYQYKQGSAVQFGHEGDGVGNSTMILYVPSSHAFIFINCTVGRQLPGPFLKKIIDLKNELCSYVVNGR